MATGYYRRSSNLTRSTSLPRTSHLELTNGYRGIRGSLSFPNGGLISSYTAEDLIPERSDRPLKCGLCTQLCIDIRMLTCGHRYCIRCLSNKLRDYLIECPNYNCEDVTQIIPGQKVEDLPKPQIPKALPLKTVVILDLISWSGVAFLEENNWLLVRSSIPDAPIKIFSYQGSEIQAIGKKEISNSDTHCSQICVDTRRGYILTTTKTKLIIYDSIGHFISQIFKKEFRALAGVAYHAHSDIYVLTDISSNCVFHVDPVSHNIVVTYGSYGRNDTQFNWPIAVCCDKTGQSPMIAVSDTRNRVIKLFDPRGKYENKISFGDGINQKGMYGITMDAKRRILACDQANRKVLRVWPDVEPGIPQIEEILPTPQQTISNPYVIDTTNNGLMCLTTGTSNAPKQVVMCMGYQ